MWREVKRMKMSKGTIGKRKSRTKANTDGDSARLRSSIKIRRRFPMSHTSGLREIRSDEMNEFGRTSRMGTGWRD
jgi:hypothetical protein